VLRAKLARLGVEAVVQRIAIDANVFHRVRIGPINDLEALNRTRARLRAADIDAVVIRVGD
jgi:cell division protein FtsN